jgi:hypothetical protein
MVCDNDGKEGSAKNERSNIFENMTLLLSVPVALIAL